MLTLRRSTAVIGLALAAVMLSACGTPSDPPASQAPTPAPTTPAAVETTPAAEETTPAAALTVPTDCSQIEQLPSLAGKLPARQPEGAGSTGPMKDLAGEYLFGCSWFEGDTTGGTVMLHRVDPSASTAALTALAAEGFTCTDVDGATTCAMEKPNSQYPVTDYTTYYVRDDVWLTIRSTNVDIPAGLNDIVALVWS